MSEQWRPGVAVVVPCRDAAPWLEQLLDSLQRQTRRPDAVVLVDDGSVDGSADVAEAWSRGSDLPLLVLRRPADGLRAAVAATDLALVARVDADDELHPRYLEALEDALGRHPEAAYAYPVMELFGTARGRYPTRAFDPAALVMEGNFVSAAALVRREAWERVGGLSDLPAWEDWDLWLSMLDAGLVGVLVDEPLYRWRRHERSRNTMPLLRRRVLRLRVLWRHRRLLARYGARGLPGAVRRVLRPIGQQ